MKGETKTKERRAWESLRLRMEKSCDEGGKPAARNREAKRPWIMGKRKGEERNDWERRVATAKGRRRRHGAEVNLSMF